MIDLNEYVKRSYESDMRFRMAIKDAYWRGVTHAFVFASVCAALIAWMVQ